MTQVLQADAFDQICSEGDLLINHLPSEVSFTFVSNSYNLRMAGERIDGGVECIAEYEILLNGKNLGTTIAVLCAFKDGLISYSVVDELEESFRIAIENAFGGKYFEDESISEQAGQFELNGIYEINAAMILEFLANSIVGKVERNRVIKEINKWQRGVQPRMVKGYPNIFFMNIGPISIFFTKINGTLVPIEKQGANFMICDSIYHNMIEQAESRYSRFNEA